MENKYTNTQHVLAFSFVIFMLALTVPAKLALAYPGVNATSISFSLLDGMANAISATPAFSLFALGFISAVLFLGIVWDKFSFESIILDGRLGVRKRQKRSAKRSRRNGGFISYDLISFSILSVMMVAVLTSPVFV